MARQVVEKPFNSGNWSRARFFSFIRSALRLASRKWPPRIEAKVRARRKIQSPGRSKNQKWEFCCASCGEWFPDKEVEVDHIAPAGSLKCYDDLPGFVSRLFCEASGMRVLCRDCHGARDDDMKVAD
jgi:5-methylcytosine-specific restriction endonuclease McrA